MGIKSVTLATGFIVTIFSIALPTAVYAESTVDIRTIKDIWAHSGTTPKFDNHHRKLGIYAFEYFTEDSKGNIIARGLLSIDGTVGKPFPKKWAMIQYRSHNEIYDGNIMAINEGDGTATHYMPGEYPY